MIDLSFFKGKKVLVTGHTGFKGTWMCRTLIGAGAEVTGYSLEPPTDPNLFTMAGIEDKMNSVIADIRDLDKLSKVFRETTPEIVIHLAAQPIVRDSYKEPVYTYETNVMGTVNICECVRQNECVKSFLNVTTDKVYENFVRQIAGKTLSSGAGETLKESVERDTRRQELQKQIVALQVKVHRERKLNKQVQLNAELKRLKKELEEL